MYPIAPQLVVSRVQKHYSVGVLRESNFILNESAKLLVLIDLST